MPHSWRSSSLGCFCPQWKQSGCGSDVSMLCAETIKSLELQVLVARLGLLPPGAKSRTKGQLAELLLPQLLDQNCNEVRACLCIASQCYCAGIICCNSPPHLTNFEQAPDFAIGRAAADLPNGFKFGQSLVLIEASMTGQQYACTWRYSLNPQQRLFT